VLPSRLQIEGVTVARGTATVSLPGRLEREVGGENTALLAIQSIVYTLTEREDVQQVQFLIGGRKLSSFAGVLDLSKPQRRDETLLEER
jgi:spore germination protein GerM